MNWITLILTILGNLSKVLPKWYERWTKRGDLAYLEERARIRRECKELWRRYKEAEGEAKQKAFDKYIDFIRKH
jgi:hypothetical protein